MLILFIIFYVNNSWPKVLKNKLLKYDIKHFLLKLKKASKKML